MRVLHCRPLTACGAQPEQRSAIQYTCSSGKTGLLHNRMHPIAERHPQKRGNMKAVKLTQAECDTIIAALRLWQRAPAYPEIEISEEHGEALGDTEIDTLIEEKLNGDAKTRNA